MVIILVVEIKSENLKDELLVNIKEEEEEQEQEEEQEEEEGEEEDENNEEEEEVDNEEEEEDILNNNENYTQRSFVLSEGIKEEDTDEKWYNLSQLGK